MLGKRSHQRGLFEADHQYLDMVGRESFYGFIASQRGKLFRDEEFAEFYVLDNGRPSVAPSLLATALLLQAHDGVSDAEAKARADFDLRWKVGLGIGVEERPFAKSTLQEFRTQLIVHEKLGQVFWKSVCFARANGYGKSGKVKAAMDTAAILGRGAVKDSYNLLGDAIGVVAQALATETGSQPEAWAQEHEMERYFGSSLKGEAAIDWDSAAARRQLLSGMVADADRLLGMVRQRLADESGCAASERGRLVAASELLARLMMQDIERGEDGARIREGVARDRIVSVHDPEMRHGRKSAAKRFDGYKAAVVVDGETGLILAATVLAGNAADNERALELIEAAESNAQVEVEETVADCAYGDGMTREEFAAAGRKLVAKVPVAHESAWFNKEAFTIDLESKSCVCPAGERCTKLVSLGYCTNRKGQRQKVQGFEFAVAVCRACPERAQCVRGKAGRGRTVRLHPQEALLQQARALQHSEAFAPYRRLRQTAEHRLARLMQLGVRQARYFGPVKVLGQLLLAAAVANLTLVATRMGLMRGRRPGSLALEPCT